MTGVQQKTVSNDEGGIRLDRWFKRHFPGLSHGGLEKLLRTGQVRLDGKRAKAADRLAVGQIVRVPPMDSTAAETRPRRDVAPAKSKYDLNDAILHMDDVMIVLNKPPGLASQGGPGITESVDSLLDQLRFGRKQRPRLVHRLDRDTSGVLVIARTAPAAASLAGAFRERDTKKVYWALTAGVPKPHQGQIKAALLKVAAGPGRSNEKMVVSDPKTDEDAKRAVTRYRVIDTAAQKAAWVAMMPVTGRTHQLRAHAASIGTPIAGDFKYGAEDARLSGGAISAKLHLHARSLRVRHPDGGYLDVTAPLPAHMLKSWALFGWNPDDKSDPFPDV
jgi:23S rRNA pseudouridine955/2504/2580 synthase